MASTSINMTLDFYRNQTVVARARQNDIGRSIIITCTQNGQAVTFQSDERASIELVKPSGKFVIDDVSIVNDKIIAPLTQQILAESGVLKMCVMIYGSSSSEVLHTMNAAIVVEEGIITDENVQSIDEVTALYKLMNDSSDRIRVMDSLENTITSNESGRIAAELQRERNEETRKSNETSRQSEESSRVSAENSRVSAEKSRVSAENSRVEAEKNRVSEFNSLKQQISDNYSDFTQEVQTLLNEQSATPASVDESTNYVNSGTTVSGTIPTKEKVTKLEFIKNVYDNLNNTITTKYNELNNTITTKYNDLLSRITNLQLNLSDYKVKNIKVYRTEELGLHSNAESLDGTPLVVSGKTVTNKFELPSDKNFIAVAGYDLNGGGCSFLNICELFVTSENGKPYVVVTHRLLDSGQYSGITINMRLLYKE